MVQAGASKYMNSLPIFQTKDQTLSLLQTSWKAALTPVIQNEINQGLLIQANLAVGVNVINHLLSRTQIGWVVTDVNAVAKIYRSAALNDTTLTLTSDAICSVSLWCF